MPDLNVPATDEAAHDVSPSPAPAERPEWLSDKFANPEQMAVAYAELERRLGAGDDVQPVTTDTEPDPAPAADPEVTTDVDEESAEVSYGTAVDGVLSGAGIAPADVAAHYEANGTVSEEHYAALEAAGYPKAMVDGYMKSMQADAAPAGANDSGPSAEDITAVKSVAGGEDRYNDMIKWAGTNLSPAEIASFNAAMDSNNTGLAVIAAKDVFARFSASEGTEPTTVIAQAGGRPSADVFANHTAMHNALKAAKATGDPALVRAVEQKALRSPAL